MRAIATSVIILSAVVCVVWIFVARAPAVPPAPNVITPPVHHSFSGSASPTVAVHIDRSGNGNGRVSVHVACLSTTAGVSRCRSFNMRDVVRQHIFPRNISVVDYMQVDGMRENHVLNEMARWFEHPESKLLTIRALVVDTAQAAHAFRDVLAQHGYACGPIPHLEAESNSKLATSDLWDALHGDAADPQAAPAGLLLWSADLPVLVDLVCLQQPAREGRREEGTEEEQVHGLEVPRRQPAPQQGITDDSSGIMSEVDHIYVLTLQGVPNAAEHNKGRFDTFREAWTSACGPGFMEHVSQCPGNVDPRKGFGVGRTFVQCMELALREGRADTAVFMEDDARPFAEVVRRPRVEGICNTAWRRRILAAAPQDALLTLIGGHEFVYDISGLPPARRRQWEPRTELGRPGAATVEWVQSLWSEGLYGFAVRRRHLHFLSAMFSHELAFGEFGASLTPASEPTLPDGCVDAATPEACVWVGPTLPSWPEDAWNTQRNPARDMISPDLRFYAAALTTRLRVYASNPLLVFHHSGQSNTWKRARPDVTGRHDYRTFSTPRRLPGHGDRTAVPLCRLSDPLYNLTMLTYFESEALTSLEAARAACTEDFRCGGVTRTLLTNTTPPVQQYHVISEPMPLRNPEHERLRRKYDYGRAIPEELPMSYWLDPFYPCLGYLETT